jgi:hypothetical protein
MKVAISLVLATGIGVLCRVSDILVLTSDGAEPLR